MEFVRVENRWSCWGASWHGVGVEGRSQALPSMRGCAPHRDWSWPWPPPSKAGPARGKCLAGGSDGITGPRASLWRTGQGVPICARCKTRARRLPGSVAAALRDVAGLGLPCRIVVGGSPHGRRGGHLLRAQWDSGRARPTAMLARRRSGGPVRRGCPRSVASVWEDSLHLVVRWTLSREPPMRALR